MKIKYFPIEISFSRRNMEKHQAAGRLVIRRPCPVLSEGKKKVSRLDLFALCVQGR